MSALVQQMLEDHSSRNGGRLSYASRRRAARAAAHARIARRSVVVPSPECRRYDPLNHVRPGGLGRALRIGLLATAAVGAHFFIIAAFYGGSALLSSGNSRRADERLAVTVVDTTPPPPPPKVQEPPRPKETPKPAPKVALAPKPAQPPPPDPINKPKQPEAAPKREIRRIVGLSLESTVSGGGSGPSFAVGNTRMGETATRAEDPTAIEKAPPAPPPVNRVATRLPTTTVSYKAPVKRRSVKPEYPPALRAQGVEADVVLAVTIDGEGRVESVAVAKPSPYPELDAAAVAAARAEEYAPAQRDGTPVGDTVTFTVRFRLTD